MSDSQTACGPSQRENSLPPQEIEDAQSELSLFSGLDLTRWNGSLQKMNQWVAIEQES